MTKDFFAWGKELITSCPHELLTPGHGQPQPEHGCFYCGGEESEELVFSYEFDWYIHCCCIVKAHQEDPTDQGVQILMEEFEIKTLGDQ